jgi:serine/threonine protein kinase
MIDQSVAHYKITARLGAGGMGEVYLAEDTNLDRKVALKILPGAVADDPVRRQRFIKEAKAASALNHPHVCVIYEVGETPDGHLFLAMEFVDGQALDVLTRQGPLPIGQTVDISIQIADALDAAHAKGIAHRDIKPANIILGERGVKVLDFGLAKRVGQPPAGQTSEIGQTGFGHVVGTPSHMSPEQALGKTVDHRTDLFSLGVVLYELVTGRRPFSGGSIAETVHNVVNAQPEAIARFNYDVPGELERIIRKCLQKDADLRYQSARELLIDLRNLKSDLGGAGPRFPTASFTDLGAAVDDVRGSDIYISSARIDDQPLGPGKEGWVSQFQRNLKVRLEQLSGETVKIANHPMPPGPAPANDTRLQDVTAVRTMISVLSPPFVRSEGCRREVEGFWQSAADSGDFRIEDKARLFKVVKAPLDACELSPNLQGVLEQLVPYEFFERDPETGRLREFDEAFGETARQRYHEKVYDLAYEIAQVLKLQRNQATGRPKDGKPAPRVYLAETTSDLQAARDGLRRELLEQGCIVLPDRPLPHIAGELDVAVRGYLEQCELAIHPVGERYGLVPEDSDRSVVAQQNLLAAQHSAAVGLERLIWMPRQVQARDERQAAFLRELREDPEAHRGAEIIQDTLENLKEILQDRWRKQEQAVEAAAVVPAAAGGIPRVYLICDRQDETAVEAVEDYFFAQGIEVCLPEFEQDEATVSRIHWQNLEDCDGVLIYFGAGGKAWVDIKVRDLLKAVGYRKGRPIELQAVFVAPPFDRRKERFKTLSAETIRQESEAFDPTVLAAFVSRLKKLKAGNEP